MKIKKLVAALTAIVSLSVQMPSIAINATKPNVSPSGKEYLNINVEVDDFDDTSSEEMFEMYVQQHLYGENGISPFAIYDWESQLSNTDYYLFLQFKEEIRKIANGERSDTEIFIPFTEEQQEEFKIFNSVDSDTVWFGSDYVMTNDGKQAINELLNNTVDLSAVYYSLLMACPYEMYWFDKEGDLRFSYSYNRGYYPNGDQELSLFGIYFIIPVAPEFQGSEYSVSTPASKIETVKSNAEEIVQKYADSSDYDKLLGYKNEICNLVEYEHNYDGIHYGNVWQLLNVLDGDTSTNVVCEGYSKAFQYLCDLTDFDDDIYCYTVTGKMNGGNHMWNIVNMSNNKNYLVDVTNCDSGTSGYPDYLFLTSGRVCGYINGVYPAYAVANRNTKDIQYNYDANTISTYSVEDLTLAESKFPPHKEHQFADNKCSTVCSICGASNNSTVSHDMPVGVSYIKNDTTHSYTCSSCGEYVSENHKYAVTKLANATCTDSAKYKKTCSVCEYSLDYSEGEPLGHSVKHYSKVNPTCIKKGTLEYWTCDREEGIYYRNSDLTETYTDYSEITIPETGKHVYDRYHCENCNKIKSGFMLVDSYKANNRKPVITGMTFVGWYYDENCTKEYTELKGYAFAKFVKTSLSIIQQPQDVSVSTSSTATFTVEAQGEDLRYTWYYKIPTSKTYKKYADNMTDVFNMTTSKTKNGTMIYCVISDKYGNTVKTDTVRLTVF